MNLALNQSLVWSQDAAAATPLAQDLEAFLEHCRDRRFSRHTCQSYRSVNKRLLNWLRDCRGVTRAERLRAADLHGYQHHLSTVLSRRGLPLKPSTINRCIHGARSFLAWLQARGRLARPLQDQLQTVREPQILPTSVLTHEQVKSLIAAIDTTSPEGLRDRAVIELLYSSGIRVGELEQITVNDLDLDAGVLRVTGKGEKERLVPVGRTACRFLTSYLRGARQVFARHNPGVRELFLTSTGSALRGHRIRHYLHRYAREAGLETEQSITPHTLRRSCTTEMIRADANLYHVKEILGHERLDTLKHYAKLNINDLKATHARCHPRERDAE